MRFEQLCVLNRTVMVRSLTVKKMKSGDVNSPDKPSLYKIDLGLYSVVSYFLCLVPALGRRHVSLPDTHPLILL